MPYRYNPFTDNFDEVKTHLRPDEKLCFDYPNNTVCIVYSSADSELQVTFNDVKVSGDKP